MALKPEDREFLRWAVRIHKESLIAASRVAYSSYSLTVQFTPEKLGSYGIIGITGGVDVVRCNICLTVSAVLYQSMKDYWCFNLFLLQFYTYIIHPRITCLRFDWGRFKRGGGRYVMPECGELKYPVICPHHGFVRRKFLLSPYVLSFLLIEHPICS